MNGLVDENSIFTLYYQVKLSLPLLTHTPTRNQPPALLNLHLFYVKCLISQI